MEEVIMKAAEEVHVVLIITFRLRLHCFSDYSRELGFILPIEAICSALLPLWAIIYKHIFGVTWLHFVF